MPKYKKHIRPIHLALTVERPPGVSKALLLAYVRDAIRCMSRGGDPDSGLWDVGDYPIKVWEVKP